MYCKKCGKELQQEEIFCMKCGTKNDEQEIEKNEKIEMLKQEGKSELRKKFSKAIIIAISVCAFLEICFILTGAVAKLSGTVFSTVIAIAVFGAAGSSCITLYEDTEHKSLSNYGMITMGICFCFVNIIIWFVSNVKVSTMKSVSICYVLAYTILHCFTVLATKLKPEYQKYIKFTIVFVITTAIIVAHLILNDLKVSSFTYRLLAISVILNLLGTSAVEISKRVK